MAGVLERLPGLANGGEGYWALGAAQQGEAGLADAAVGVGFEAGDGDGLFVGGLDRDPAFGTDPAEAGQLVERDAGGAGAIGGVGEQQAEGDARGAGGGGRTGATVAPSGGPPRCQD